MQIYGVSDMAPACQLREEGSEKETIVSASTSVWEKAAPTAVSLMPDNSVPPHMFPMYFEVLLHCLSSETVSLSKSMCGPFKRNSWDSRSPLSHLAKILVYFYSEKF